jgi:hypothetical protein
MNQFLRPTTLCGVGHSVVAFTEPPDEIGRMADIHLSPALAAPNVNDEHGKSGAPGGTPLRRKIAPDWALEIP